MPETPSGRNTRHTTNAILNPHTLVVLCALTGQPDNHITLTSATPTTIMTRRAFFIGLLMAIATISSLQADPVTEPMTYAVAINVAGSQRMLTQRMLKAYCAIGIEIDVHNATQQLLESVARFERQLEMLADTHADTEVTQALQEVKRLWDPHKVVLMRPVTQDNALHLLRSNEELLRAAHRVVLILEDMSDTAQGQLINIAGRQRMLTQRLAKF